MRLPGDEPTPAWSPADLFADGDGGSWYDFSDASTLFQDEAGTVPVTSDNDPVRRIEDRSGNGHHLIAQSENAVRRWRTDGKKGWLEFKEDQSEPMEAELSLPASGFSFAQAMVYTETNKDSGNSDLWHTHDGTGASGVRFRLDYKRGTSNDWEILVFEDGEVSPRYIDNNFADFDELKVVSGFLSASEQRVWVDGTQRLDATARPQRMNTDYLLLGDDESGGDPMIGRLYGLIFVARDWASDTERQQVEAWLAAKAQA